MPPTRRRPIPTPPAGGRPKVAGVGKRAADPVEAPVEEPQVDEAVEAVEAVEAAEPVEVPEVVEVVEVAEPVEVTEKKSEGWLLPAALFVVALLIGGLGFWFHQQARSVTMNRALVDAGATAAVNGQVREAIEKTFSYNFADVEATEKAANELLTGKAKCQYNAVFGPVKEYAPAQKIVVTVRVVTSAVTSLKDDRATVLLFVDQVHTRTTDNQTGGGRAVMRVSSPLTDGRWKIDNMELFGETAEQTQQMDKCA